MLRKVGLLTLWVSLCVMTAWGQAEQVKYGNDFLNIGVGARAFGMGNAQTAVAHDVTAAYWNPAGLVQQRQIIQKPEVALMYAAYFANIATYNYGAVSIPLSPLGDKRLGITMIRLGVDDIPNTLNLIREDGSFNYDAVSSFSSTDFATLLSYAWVPKKVDGLSLGTSVKVIYRGAGEFANSWGFGIDIGAVYKKGNLNLGASLKDATNTFNAWTFNTTTFEEAFINTGNEIPRNSVLRIPPSLRLGIAYKLSLAKRVKVLLALDSNTFFDGERSSLITLGGMSVDPHAGMEFSYLNSQKEPIAFLRLGAYNLQNEKNLEGEDSIGFFPTAGLGVAINSFKIDYALANIGNLSENLHSHVVSIQFMLE
ncbi:MAG: PorV/PorQ family protein [Bacteroidota bacterium]